MVDFFDIFRADVGVGPSTGGVVRLSRYAQLGYRTMHPFSLRAGLMGRSLPVVVETDNEFGVGPAFHTSRDRNVCKGELGLGLDLLIVGGYVGVCVDEAADFVAGLLLFDPLGDDPLD